MGRQPPQGEQRGRDALQLPGQPAHEHHRAKPYAFAYDANGNTTAENVKTYIYNQNQRLIKVTEQSGEQTLTSGEYAFNGNGQRVKKTVAGQK